MNRIINGNRTADAVPILDLKAQVELLRKEIHQALDCVLTNTAFANGPAVAQFEKEFAMYCRTADCIGVNTGTSALHVAAQCLDVGSGDEVITVSMSFIATGWPILYLGATPVFVDIDPARYTMDPKQIEAAITSRTKAIIVVHLYGQCADMDPILEIAASRGVPVIEDCAQAHGAEYKGRRAGSMGIMGCFSFYPSKNLSALGEGGAVTTNNPELAARARRLRDHAQTERYVHEEIGYNYRMDDFQGAVLSVKLKYLDSWTEARQASAATYDRLLAGTSVFLPKSCSSVRHVRHLYVIRDRDRDELQTRLQEHNVATGLHYPIPIHLQSPFRVFGYEEGDLPVTEEHARSCLSLPLYPGISEAQIERVVEAICAAGR
jgi:dTDP-4-amino-4,6-dideoxygalactose transaminase